MRQDSTLILEFLWVENANTNGQLPQVRNVVIDLDKVHTIEISCKYKPLKSYLSTREIGLSFLFVDGGRRFVHGTELTSASFAEMIAILSHKKLLPENI